jgi:hypothetical protein
METPSRISDARWSSSSYSSNAHYCVEVALLPDAVGVRDTKNRCGETLVFTSQQWSSFVCAIKRQEAR